MPQKVPTVKKQPPPNDAVTHKLEVKKFNIRKGICRNAHRIGLYGPGGVGKTTLTSLMASTGIMPKFLDLESGSEDLDVARIDGIESWQDLRDALHSPSLWNDNDCPAIDTATNAEGLATIHTIKHVPHEKGHIIRSIEDYGWGKGYTHVAETFLALFADLDVHYRAGRNVIVICQSCTANVPNPTGTDFLQYQPNLQDSLRNNKSNIRTRFRDWCDHLLYLDFDRYVSEDGKAVGSGSRTINVNALPTYWAKSRTLKQPIPFPEGDAGLWNELFTNNKKEQSHATN